VDIAFLHNSNVVENKLIFWFIYKFICRHLHCFTLVTLWLWWLRSVSYRHNL